MSFMTGLLVGANLTSGVINFALGNYAVSAFNLMVVMILALIKSS